MKIWIIEKHEPEEMLVLDTAYADEATAHHVLDLLRDTTRGIYSCKELTILGSHSHDNRISDLNDLGLTIRTSNVLKAAGIFDVQGIVQAGENKLRTLPNLGPGTFNEIKRALNRRGIDLGK